MRWRASSCSNASCIPREFAPPQPKQGFSCFGSSLMNHSKLHQFLKNSRVSLCHVTWKDAAAFSASSLDQFTSQHSYCLAGNEHAVALTTGAHKSAARRSLISDQIVPAETFLPERSQATVGGAGDRVFINSRPWSEEAPHKIAIRTRRSAGDNQSARPQPADLRGVRAQRTHGIFIFRFGKIVKTSQANAFDSYSECRLHFFVGNAVADGRRGGKIQLDPGSLLLGSEDTGSSMETRGLILSEMSLLPKHMRARQRRVATQIDLDRWRKPAQIESVSALH